MRTWVAFGVCILLTGCGGGDGRPMPETVDVSGVVTIGGKPIEGVEVHFHGGEFAGYGKTDSQGHYHLIQGAVPGENKVFFSKIEGGNVVLDPEGGMDEMQLQIAAESAGQGGGSSLNVPKQIVPLEYSSADRSQLKFTVPEGGTDSANFKL